MVELDWQRHSHLSEQRLVAWGRGHQTAPVSFTTPASWQLWNLRQTLKAVTMGTSVGSLPGMHVGGDSPAESRNLARNVRRPWH